MSAPPKKPPKALPTTAAVPAEALSAPPASTLSEKPTVPLAAMPAPPPPPVRPPPPQLPKQPIVMSTSSQSPPPPPAKVATSSQASVGLPAAAASLSSASTQSSSSAVPKGAASRSSIIDRMSVISTASFGSATGDFEEADVIRRGNLHKIGKDGVEDSCEFVLTHTAVHYHVTSGPGVLMGAASKFKSVLLNSIVVSRTEPDTNFKLLSKVKSFVVRCDNSSECQAWLHDISEIARDVQTKELGRVLSESETQPIFIGKQEVSKCQVCNKGFGFLSRRHHCRNCGKCVCDECSREKVRIPRIEERTLFKVCNDCARELKNERSYGV